MKLQFKHQSFQADAVKAVVDVFAGQPYFARGVQMEEGGSREHLSNCVQMEEGGSREHLSNCVQMEEGGSRDFGLWPNAAVVPELTDAAILGNLWQVQKGNQIAPSDQLEGRFNLTVEMETGVGKTYTYIKTMYELNRRYGWSKFVVVVPSIAIREGVYRSLQVTQEHFAQEYGKKARFFVYQSDRLAEIAHFASDSSLNVMIINAQAFNARGRDARRIYMKLDAFCSRRPIEYIAGTNPIVVIDEPQSVEGTQTKEGLKRFQPLMTLRYSATHRPGSLYNLVYRLDAVAAFQKRLVKKIAVKGITQAGPGATDSYIYLEGVSLSEAEPAAVVQFDWKGPAGICKKTRKVQIGYDLYEHSGGLLEYKDGFVVQDIDGRDDSIVFLNGIKVYAGDAVGRVSEEQMRRIQIRETILSHIERERQLFSKNIKVLSLFFIDEVAHYRSYDQAGRPQSGIFARMFEEEYQDVIDAVRRENGDDGYQKYLAAIQPSDTHAGYFSIDKKGHMVDRIAGDDKKRNTSNDLDAYDLIMRNKERLLDCDPKRSPVRFLFSHSALREGWDNPNVFQICTLKQGGSEVRKRQEVGRGLRLCVNQAGERMDADVLGDDVHKINVLTVIAGESYESFARGLQAELADERNAYGPGDARRMDGGGGIAGDSGMDGDGIAGDSGMDGGNSIANSGGIAGGSGIVGGNGFGGMMPENARASHIKLQVDQEKLNSGEFQSLWSNISVKSVFLASFDSDRLVREAVASLNQSLRVPKVFFQVETGPVATGQVETGQMETGWLDGRQKALSDVSSMAGGGVPATAAYQKPDVEQSAAGCRNQRQNKVQSAAGSRTKYDLVGRLVDDTGLTRKEVVAVFTGIEKRVFDQFKDNPEGFMARAATLLNRQKAAAVMGHIAYRAMDERYGTQLFTEAVIKGRLGVNAMRAKKHLYSHVVYDCAKEKEFVEKLDNASEVAVYAKLPEGFCVSTPAGPCRPDWAIAFYEGTVKHRYFVVQAIWPGNPAGRGEADERKVACAREHFRTVSNGRAVYDVVDSFETLLQKAMG